MKKPASSIAPRSSLAIAGKARPPKIEKLRGDELPPPDRLPAPLSGDKKRAKGV